MAISQLFRRSSPVESEPERSPARKAYQQTNATVRHSLAEQEAIAQAPESLQNALATAEVDATATAELTGVSKDPSHIAAIRAQLEEARRLAPTAALRAAIEAEKSRRLATQIDAVRAQIRTAVQPLSDLQHAALAEDLAAIAPALAEARDAYIARLVGAFALAAVMDDVARERPSLGFMGKLDIGALLFPFPRATAFRERDVQRPDIVAALDTEVRRVRRAL
jgi:hypothetical protein